MKWSFYQKISKSRRIISIKNRGFCGVKLEPLGPLTIHVAIHRIKIEGYYLENLNFQSRCQGIFSLRWDGAKLQFQSKNKKSYNLNISQPIQMRIGMSKQHLPKLLWHTKSEYKRWTTISVKIYPNSFSVQYKIS